ncbi:MAG: hypothetical protein LBG15_08005 [Dysgonamonadaceae bacterium]|nr:hypothetical protein [Dysgonamonadaceae bacterium]
MNFKLSFGTRFYLVRTGAATTLDFPTNQHLENTISGTQEYPPKGISCDTVIDLVHKINIVIFAQNKKIAPCCLESYLMLSLNYVSSKERGLIKHHGTKVRIIIECTNFFFDELRKT